MLGQVEPEGRCFSAQLDRCESCLYGGISKTRYPMGRCMCVVESHGEKGTETNSCYHKSMLSLKAPFRAGEMLMASSGEPGFGC